MMCPHARPAGSYCPHCHGTPVEHVPADLLTPEERAHVEEIRHWATGTRFLAIIDRLAPPVTT